LCAGASALHRHLEQTETPLTTSRLLSVLSRVSVVTA